MSLHRPPAWTEQAACQGMTGPDFDPWVVDDDLPRREQARLTAMARIVCSTCPVRLACAVDALTKGEPHGMRGGLTVADRRLVARLFGFPMPGSASHGSRSKYVAGCRCEDCTYAHASYARDRRATLREARIPIVEPPYLHAAQGKGRWRAMPGQYVLTLDTNLTGEAA